MKQRFGALLCLALGAVLLTNGLADSGGVTVGEVSTCTPNEVGVSPAQLCPTGTITFTESTTAVASAVVRGARRDVTPQPPAGGWSVHITSTCNDPTSGMAVSTTLTVPNNGTATTGPLYVYANPGANPASCSYTYSQTNTPSGFTAAFTPASPSTITFASTSTNSSLTVKLANSTQVAASSTPPATPSSSAPSSTAPSSTAASSAAPSSSTSGSLVHESISVGPTSSAPIAATGPRRAVSSTVYLGVALLLIGAMLLITGLPRRRARHRG